ncbi:MAG: hypothetical protein IJC58_03340 [Oscillospiraceae bacterium]|nr:hypothetical protein [Oscillospiraceae bacterium]
MTEVISVRFLSGHKSYDFDPRGLTVAVGDDVIVETSQGVEFAVCCEGNHEVQDEAVVQPLCPVIRLATDADRRTLERNRAKETEAFNICQDKIADHQLEMKLVDVSCNFDGNKIIFFFTADGRVDFRELVKDLAAIFRARIELRQIGVRDEAKMLGGLGICGRPFCCKQFLPDFVPVSIKMAKTQNLSLNPTKISGTCGRLMCCLKYEQDAYEDAAKRMPKNDSFVQTPDGPGNVCEVNLLKEQVKVRLDDHNDAPRTYHNCEVQVLRNGKGSRDGIEIPDARPARYVKPAEDELVVPELVYRGDLEESILVAEAAFDDAPTRESSSRRKSSSRRGRGRRKGSPSAAAAAEQPKKEEKSAAKEVGKKPQENKPRHNKPPKGASPKQGAPKGAPAKQTGEAAAPAGKAEGTGKSRRTHRRGGRQRGGSNGASRANAKE